MISGSLDMIFSVFMTILFFKERILSECGSHIYPKDKYTVILLTTEYTLQRRLYHIDAQIQETYPL